MDTLWKDLTEFLQSHIVFTVLIAIIFLLMIINSYRKRKFNNAYLELNDKLEKYINQQSTLQVVDKELLTKDKKEDAQNKGIEGEIIVGEEIGEYLKGFKKYHKSKASKKLLLPNFDYEVHQLSTTDILECNGKYYIQNQKARIEDTEGHTKEIDHLIITNYGILVIETKNLTGIIQGDVNAQRWLKMSVDWNDYNQKSTGFKDYEVTRMFNVHNYLKQAESYKEIVEKKLESECPEILNKIKIDYLLVFCDVTKTGNVLNKKSNFAAYLSANDKSANDKRDKITYMSYKKGVCTNGEDKYSLHNRMKSFFENNEICTDDTFKEVKDIFSQCEQNEWIEL